jgi:hypothetical protein
VRVRMRPMSVAEHAIAQLIVSPTALLSGTRPPIDGATSVDLPRYVDEILASGFPTIRPLAPRARRPQLDGYLARIVEDDFPEQGHLVRRHHLDDDVLQRDPGCFDDWRQDKPAETTTAAYRDVLAQIWMVDPVPGWLPANNRLARLAQAPKHQLADPALAARLLGASCDALIQGHDPMAASAVPRRHGTLLDALFESLIALSLRVNSQQAEASASHLCTSDAKHEVDFVIERDDHRVVAIEVKLSSYVTDPDVNPSALAPREARGRTAGRRRALYRRGRLPARRRHRGSPDCAVGPMIQIAIAIKFHTAQLLQTGGYRCQPK